MKTRNWIIQTFFLFLIVNDRTSAEEPCLHREVDPAFADAHVSLMVSPLMSKQPIREIEVYWNHQYFLLGDRIAIYRSEPNDTSEPIYTFLPKAATGVQKTGLQAAFIPTADLPFVKKCLDYYVALLRNGFVRKTNCLKTEPTWLADRKDLLGGLTMEELFLPGSHDAASYVMRKQSVTESIVEKYIVTQDIDVLGQLIHGVRYLDIRVGHYPESKQIWWANHGFIRWLPMQYIVDQVKTFLDNTNEIVIFDVQEFPMGFRKNYTVHAAFVRYLEKQFEKYYLPKGYGWSSRLNTIWSSGKRLIIGYDETKVVDQHESIWPCVKHQWGDVRIIEDLFVYLNKIENGASKFNLVPRSAMAELTPSTWDVMLNRLGGLRQMAHRVNGNVTKWYDILWQYSANIVSVDFVRSTAIVDIAIDWNERRHRDKSGLIMCEDSLQTWQKPETTSIKRARSARLK